MATCAGCRRISGGCDMRSARRWCGLARRSCSSGCDRTRRRCRPRRRSLRRARARCPLAVHGARSYGQMLVCHVHAIGSVSGRSQAATGIAAARGGSRPVIDQPSCHAAVPSTAWLALRALRQEIASNLSPIRWIRVRIVMCQPSPDRPSASRTSILQYPIRTRLRRSSVFRCVLRVCRD